MSDVLRARLAEALGAHGINRYGQHDGWWECLCDPDQPFSPEHLVDVILAAPGVTTIALPAANFPDLPTEWFGERWTVWLDARRGIQIRDQGYEPTPAGARAFAAALLAAADAAEAANNG